MTRKYAHATALLLTALTPLATHAATGTWANPAGGPWADPLNWSGPVPTAQGDTAIFDSAILNSATITLDAPRTLGNLTFNNSSAGYTLATGTAGALLLDNGTSPAALTLSAGRHTISAPVQLLSSLTMTLNSYTSLAIANGISDSQPLSLSGTGSLTLAGPLAINTLAITGSDVTLGNRGPTDSLGNGTITLIPTGAGTRPILRYNFSTPLTLTTPILGDGYIWQIGSAPLTFQAQGPAAGALIVGSGSTAIADYSVATSNVFSTGYSILAQFHSTLTLTGKAAAASTQPIKTIELEHDSVLNLAAGTAGALTVTPTTLWLSGDTAVNLSAPGTTLTLTSGISVAFGRTEFNTVVNTTINFTPLTSTANNEFDLNGPGTFLTTATSSHSTIFRPYVILDSRNWSSRSNNTIQPLSNYTNDLWNGGDVTVTASSLITNGSANSVRFAAPGPATLTLAGINAVAAGILVTPDVGPNLTTLTGGTLTSTNLYVGQMNTAGDLAVASSVAAPTLTKMGPGALHLSAQNTIGTLTLLSGLVKVMHPAALSPTTEVNIAGTLDLNGYSMVIGNLNSGSLSRIGTVDNFTSAPVTLTLHGAFFAGTIQNSNGPLSLNIVGNANFRSQNTYSGATTLDHASLSLSYTTVVSDPAFNNILPVTTTLQLATGSLTFSPKATNFRTQTLNGVNLVSGASKLSQPFLATGTTLMNLGPLTRTPGATADLAPFPGTDPSLGMTTTTTTPADTALGGWATANTTDWATTFGGRVAPLSPSAYAPNLLAPGANTDATASFSSSAPSTATLRFTGTSSAPSTLTLLAATTVIASGGILQTASVTQTHVITGGAITSGNGTDLVIHTYRTANALTLASPVTDNGTTPIGLTKSGPGTLELAAAATYTGPTTINAGTFRLVVDQPNLHAVTGDGTLALAPAIGATVSSLQLTALSLAGTLTLRPSTTPSASALSRLTLSGTTNSWTGLLDLTNAPLLIQAATSIKAATLSALQNQLAYAKTHPAGITSATTLADPTHKTTVIVDNALLGLTTFYGTPADATSLLVLSTWLGDSNLDRKVNVTDLGTLATYYGQSAGASGPLKGDFNNDGQVNVTDLGLLATNYGQGTAPGATFSLESTQLPFTNYPLQSTPEPSTLLLLTLPLLLRKSRTRSVSEAPLLSGIFS